MTTHELKFDAPLVTVPVNYWTSEESDFMQSAIDEQRGAIDKMGEP